MSKQIGNLLTCDRCGFTEFLPYIGTADFDGGHTQINDFKEPEQPWGFDEKFGDRIAGYKYLDLCPKCREKFIEIKKDFLKIERR